MKGRDRLEHLDVDERIILKHVLKHGWEGLHCIHLALESFCDHGNESSDFIKSEN
jgi:hypothetical protein